MLKEGLKESQNPVQVYLDQISKISLLTREQEAMLGKQIEEAKLVAEIGVSIKTTEILAGIIKYRERLIRSFAYGMGVEYRLSLAEILHHPPIKSKLDGDMSSEREGELFREVSVAGHILERVFSREDLDQLLAGSDITTSLTSKRWQLEDYYRDIQRNGDEAFSWFTEANLKLVVSIARYSASQRVDLLDLIQEGNTGLMHAVKMFDYRKGFKFSTYATWWIKQAVGRAVISQSRTIRIPVSMSLRMEAIRYAISYLTQVWGREPTNQEIGRSVRLPEKEVMFITELESKRVPVSIDMLVGERQHALVDLLDESKSIYSQGDEDDDPANYAIRRTLRFQLERSFKDVLKPQEEAVIRERFGWDDRNSKTHSQIGKKMGVTAERIRQIEEAALSKLQELPAKDLLDYLT